MRNISTHRLFRQHNLCGFDYIILVLIDQRYLAHLHQRSIWSFDSRISSGHVSFSKNIYQSNQTKKTYKNGSGHWILRCFLQIAWVVPKIHCRGQDADSKPEAGTEAGTEPVEATAQGTLATIEFSGFWGIVPCSTQFWPEIHGEIHGETSETWSRVFLFNICNFNWALDMYCIWASSGFGTTSQISQGPGKGNHPKVGSCQEYNYNDFCNFLCEFIVFYNWLVVSNIFYFPQYMG